MKIQVRRDALTEAMRLMEMVVPRRSPKPVLQCVKLAADKKTVTLLGTNLEKIGAVRGVAGDGRRAGRGVGAIEPAP